MFRGGERAIRRNGVGIGAGIGVILPKSGRAVGRIAMVLMQINVAA